MQLDSNLGEQPQNVLYLDWWEYTSCVCAMYIMSTQVTCVDVL